MGQSGRAINEEHHGSASRQRFFFLKELREFYQRDPTRIRRLYFGIILSSEHFIWGCSSGFCRYLVSNLAFGFLCVGLFVCLGSRVWYRPFGDSRLVMHRLAYFVWVSSIRIFDV